MTRRFICVLALLLVGGLPTTARALSFAQVIVEAQVGAGANEAMLVFDWDDGLPTSHAWLFQWDGTASFSDAMNAIQVAEGGDFSWSGGNFVNFVDFDANDGDSHVTSNLGWVSTWDSLDGESWATLLVGVEDYLLADGGWAGVNPNLPVDGWPGDAPSVPIPEPSTAALVGLGLLAMARQRRSH